MYEMLPWSIVQSLKVYSVDNKKQLKKKKNWYWVKRSLDQKDVLNMKFCERKLINFPVLYTFAQETYDQNNTQVTLIII